MQPPASLHAHALEAEVVYAHNVAGGASCAQVVRNALLAFTSRPLLGLRTSDEAQAFSWIPYGTISEFVENAAWGLHTRIRHSTNPASSFGCVALCADNSPSYVVAMLASLLVESVLVPIHPVLDSPSLQHVLSKTSPTVFFVGEEYAEKTLPLLKDIALVVILPKELPDMVSTTLRYCSFFCHFS